MSEQKDMAVSLLLVHHFCGDFGILKEGLLIPLPKNLMLVFVRLFKIKIGWASLMDDLLDVFAIFSYYVRRHHCKNCISVPTLAGIVFTIEVMNDHTRVESIMDGIGSG
jgi:hypothetical protein